MIPTSLPPLQKIKKGWWGTVELSFPNQGWEDQLKDANMVQRRATQGVALTGVYFQMTCERTWNSANEDNGWRNWIIGYPEWLGKWQVKIALMRHLWRPVLRVRWRLLHRLLTRRFLERTAYISMQLCQRLADWGYYGEIRVKRNAKMQWNLKIVKYSSEWQCRWTLVLRVKAIKRMRTLLKSTSSEKDLPL